MVTLVAKAHPGAQGETPERGPHTRTHQDGGVYTAMSRGTVPPGGSHQGSPGGTSDFCNARLWPVVSFPQCARFSFSSETSRQSLCSWPTRTHGWSLLCLASRIPERQRVAEMAMKTQKRTRFSLHRSKWKVKKGDVLREECWSHEKCLSPPLPVSGLSHTKPSIRLGLHCAFADGHCVTVTSATYFYS